MFVRLLWKARDQRDGEHGEISHSFTLHFAHGSAVTKTGEALQFDVPVDLQAYREAKPGDVWELRRVGDHS